MRQPPKQHPAVTSVVRMASTVSIPEVLRTLGADPEQILAELGYDLTIFQDPEYRISYAIRNRILQHCATRANCPHLGLLVGQHNGLHTFGLVGLLVKYAPDVGAALRSFIRYLQLHVQGATVNLAVEGNIATLTWHVDDPGMDAIDHTGDGALATLYNIVHELCGSDWRPSEVRFAHRRPLDAGPFRRFFRVPLRFDADTYTLSFAAGLLKHRLPGIDDEVRSLLEREIGALEACYRDDFPAQVRSLLRTALMAGRHKAEEVAALLGMHSRTLNRRLNAFGVGFQQLLDETRFEMARQMLEYSRNEVGEISEALGYAAPGAFTRAFRRWSGTTPGEWRLHHERLKRELSAPDREAPRPRTSSAVEAQQEAT